MRAEIALAKLTPHPILPGHIVSGISTGTITPQDVAAACAGMSRGRRLPVHIYRLILRKWTLDESVHYPLLLNVREQALARAKQMAKSRRLTSSLVLHALAGVALHDVLGNTCRVCNGVGTMVLGAGAERQIAICSNCEGTGHKSPGCVTVARAMGISKQSFLQTWSRLYDEVVRDLIGWEITGLAHISERLE